MQYININTIVSKCTFYEDSIYVYNSTETVINNCKKLEQEILSEKFDNLISDALFEWLYCINLLYKSVGLAKLINCTQNLSHVDETIEKYKVSFFNNENISKILSSLNIPNEKDNIEKILRNFSNNKLSNLPNKIKKITKEIRKKLDINSILITTNEMKKYVNNLPDNLILTRQSYYYLQRKIQDTNTRNEIEKSFFQKSNNCLDLIAELISERSKYAISLGHNTFFELTQKKIHGNSNDIKSLINDLVIKIESRSRKEIDRVYRELKKDGYNKKVDLYDIIYYYEKLRTRHLFVPNKVIQILCEMVNEYFGLIMKKVVYDYELWSSNIDTYHIEGLGFIHFDLQKQSNKKITSPVSIHLCQQYLDKNNILHPTRIALIGGYADMNTKCITYSDIIYLFREIGYSIQLMSYQTQRGIMFHSDEFATLLPQIMEYIAWEKETINEICKGLDEIVPDHILFTRYIDFANSIKLRCVNAFFDHIIHNSSDVIEIINDSIKKNGNAGKVLLSIYKKIYSDIMSAQSDILNLNINGINPTLLYQEINGSEGMLYGNILTEILSYGVFSLIRSGRDKKNYKNSGNYFIKNVLNSDLGKLKKTLYKFISNLREDSYDLYLQKLIGYNEIDTDVNMKQKLLDNNSNHFAEETNEPSSDEDLEEVIHMERRLTF